MTSQLPFLDAAPVIKRTRFFPVDGYWATGIRAAARRLRALFQSPRRKASVKCRFHKLVLISHVHSKGVHTYTSCTNNLFIFLFFKTKKDVRLMFCAVCF